MRKLAIGVLMLFATAPVFGDQLTPPPPTTARFGALRSTGQQDPYRDLFTVQRQFKTATASIPKPKVVCGMTVIPGDPSVDPKMAVTPKKRDGFEFKMRALEPPVCNPAK